MSGKRGFRNLHRLNCHPVCTLTRCYPRFPHLPYGTRRTCIWQVTAVGISRSCVEKLCSGAGGWALGRGGVCM